MKWRVTYILAFLAVAGIFSASCGRSQSAAARGIPTDTTGTAILTFQKLDHDFGKVREGEKVGCIFSYTNTGDADLVITAASASCGCTVPKYDRKPIPPGGTGTFEVVFDTSGREGTQTKTVVVQSNAENNMVILRIIAEVQKDQAVGNRQ